MLRTLIAVVVALLALPQSMTAQTAASMRQDVDRLVRGAERVTETWPLQAPLPIPEVSEVARYGRRVAPLLVALLSDDPNVERDRPRWKVQQQAALALCHIYSEPQYCGRAYCDGDVSERIGNIKEGWLRVIASDAALQALSSRQLLDRFKQEKTFWVQFEIGKALAVSGHPNARAELEAWLTHDDRHLRGNAAFVLGRLGDSRGFDTIAAILADRSPRAEGQGIPGGRWTLRGQVRADRYYAAHLLGDLKDPRGVELLIPLLQDQDIAPIVPWSLSEMGDPRAIAPLIDETYKDDVATRLYTVYALETMNAREALPRLKELLQDTRKRDPNTPTVAEAAKRAIAAISQAR